jgi:hypothetical protein
MILRALLMTTGIAVAMFAAMHGPVHAQSAAEAELIGFHQLCDKGDRRACVRFGILIGENRERHAEWRRMHPEWWWWDK